jgi:hypothetical protein
VLVTWRIKINIQNFDGLESDKLENRERAG